MWQSRYFKLFTDGLMYLKSKEVKEKDALGFLPVTDMVRVYIPDDKGNKLGTLFAVTMKAVGGAKEGRTFDLGTSSREESTVILSYSHLSF
jgi:hypothetical protein